MQHLVPDWAAKQAKQEGGRPKKYPLDEMELYQVHTVHSEDIPPSGIGSIRAVLSAQGKKLARRFVCRQIETGAIEVCRVK